MKRTNILNKGNLGISKFENSISSHYDANVCAYNIFIHRCPVENCEASFETKESLHYHDIRKHQTKSIKCSYCPESFVKKFTLKEHEATHTGDKPFK